MAFFLFSAVGATSPLSVVNLLNGYSYGAWCIYENIYKMAYLDNLDYELDPVFQI